MCRFHAMHGPGEDNKDYDFMKSCPGIRRGRLSAAVTGLLLACDGTMPVNQPPEAVVTIPAQTIEAGRLARIGLSSHFSDPDADSLTYAVTTSDAATVAVTASGDTLTLVAVSPGRAGVTVTVRDSGGLTAQQTFPVLVTLAIPEVYFATLASGAPEGGVVVLEISVEEPRKSPFTVNYTIGVDDDDETDDADRSDHAGGHGGSVLIAPGTTSGRIEIPIDDDEDIEPTREVFTVTLEQHDTASQYVVGDLKTARATIEEGVCDRSTVIRDYIVEDAGAAECSELTDEGLARIRWMQIVGQEPFPTRYAAENGPSDETCSPEPGRLNVLGEDPATHRGVCDRPDQYSLSAQRVQPDSEVSTQVPPNTIRVGDFAGLTNLQRLNLINLGLSDLPAGVFSNLSGVTFMSLLGNRLTTLVPGIFEGLLSLEALQLTANPYTELGSWSFAGLPSLKALELRLTPLTELPADLFSEIPTLTWLSLQSNRLKGLSPGQFSYLSDLEHLFLRDNQIDILPENLLAGLDKLRELELWINRIQELPPGMFSDLRSLEVLDLRSNVLQELPPGILMGLGKLRKLALDGNPGAPFQFTAELVRTDNDLLAPGPAKAALRMVHGAPVAMTIPLSVLDGNISADSLSIDAGSIVGQEIEVTRGTQDRTGTQVITGPVPQLPQEIRGIQIKVSDPLVLFAKVPNRAPVAEREIQRQRLRATAERVVTASGFFRDPDGDPLVYTAVSDVPGVVSASVEGSRVTLHPGTGGLAKVTVTATDPGGLSAESSFGVTVREPASGNFDIDLILMGTVTDSLETTFLEAANHWMSILSATELPNIPVNGVPAGCGHIVSQESIEEVDEIVIVAMVEEVDGPGGILGSAGVCGIREGRMGLPFMGAMSFDLQDLKQLQASGDIKEVILHEMGHCLGIGTLWERQDLLGNPSQQSSDGADTHFRGPLAIGAFNNAGGVRYTGAKVPVENWAGTGSADTHWRESVLRNELMTPFQDGNVPDPLSAITIQSLADLGYTVDVEMAEPFDLSVSAARDMSVPIRRIRYGSDVVRWPIMVVDVTGRVVRVIAD